MKSTNQAHNRIKRNSGALISRTEEKHADLPSKWEILSGISFVGYDMGRYGIRKMPDLT